MNNLAEQLVKEAILKGITDFEHLQMLKNEFSKVHKVNLITNVELLDAYRDLINRGELEMDRDLWKLLRKRGIRSKSGITSITLITKNYPCPGNCIFCPTEPEMPKSYLSNEPAVMRAILSEFDAYKQTKNRLTSLERSGHFTDKLDVIVSGGTFSYYDHRYQTDFVRKMFNALNFPHEPSRSLIEAQKINETADHRCIGLSFETRPDHVTEEEVKRLRMLGATKIEIGLQSLNDKVLEMNKRGHTVEEGIQAIRLLKDAGFKVNVHMMPNLYGSDIENDLADFHKLFGDSNYKPDWLKIYPCMVVPWSELEERYKDGLYKPYSDDELVSLLIKIKQTVPDYCRITRLYRDIPAPTIIAGSKLSNIRQLIQQKMDRESIKCRCIRCREIKDEKVDPSDLELRVLEMEASNGKEFFISYNTKSTDRLCSLLRLRFSSYSLNGKKHFIDELNGAAIIREVHTYGEQLKIKTQEGLSSQHIGLGRLMLKEAERISRENGFKKIAVISGIGVRQYYEKNGYHLEGTYMVKYLNS